MNRVISPGIYNVSNGLRCLVAGLEIKQRLETALQIGNSPEKEKATQAERHSPH
jgi:hypothetical protein